MKRKQFLTGAAALAAAFVARGTARAATYPGPSEETQLYENAKKEGRLIWYGGAPLEPMQLMAKDFEARYPGVKVEILRMVGVAQYQRFMQETEAGQYIADVLHVGDEPSMADLVEQGHIVDWKVPTFDRVPASARIKTFAYTAYVIDGSIGYNPNRVSPDEIAILGRDWNGILDPRFKNRLATTDQRAGGHVAAIEMFLDPKFKDVFGPKYLKALAEQKPAVYNDVVVPIDRVIAGERDICFWPSEGTMVVKWDQGAPIRWLHPKPNIAFGNTWFGVSKYAPHGNAARLFLNWVMSDAGAAAVETKYGGIPILTGVEDTRPVTREPWYQKITDPYIVDWERWTNESDKDYALWLNLLKANR